MEPEDRSKAILEFCEMVVRGITKERCASDPYRWNTVVKCTEKLLENLKYLRLAARAAWDNNGTNFSGALSSAHSMRIVEVDKDAKRSKRQVSRKCDVCGRTEQWCGMAFDLGGGACFDQDSFLDVTPAATNWNKFINGYCDDCSESDVDDAGDADHPQSGKLHRSDLGRFYVGKTCLRKAKVSFVASMFLLETLYEAWAVVQNERDLHGELDPGTVYTSRECRKHLVEEHVAKTKNIMVAVGSESKWDVPDVPYDETFWVVVDAHRRRSARDAKALDDMLRRRVKETLRNAPSGTASASANMGAQTQVEDVSSEEDFDDHRSVGIEDFIVDDDEDISENEELWEEDEMPRLSQGRRASASPRKRMRVVDDDDSDDSDDGGKQPPSSPACGPRTRGAERRAKAGVSSQPSKARPPPPQPPRGAKGKSKRRGEKELVLVEPEKEGFDDGDSVDGDDVNEKRLAIAPPIKSAVAVARAMRRPTADGAPPSLANRREVLANMKRLATRLMNESRYEDLALLQPGIITLHELIEYTEG